MSAAQETSVLLAGQGSLCTNARELKSRDDIVVWMKTIGSKGVNMLCIGPQEWSTYVQCAVLDTGHAIYLRHVHSLSWKFETVTVRSKNQTDAKAIQQHSCVIYREMGGQRMWDHEAMNAMTLPSKHKDLVFLHADYIYNTVGDGNVRAINPSADSLHVSEETFIWILTDCLTGSPNGFQSELADFKSCHGDKKVTSICVGDEQKERFSHVRCAILSPGDIFIAPYANHQLTWNFVNANTLRETPLASCVIYQGAEKKPAVYLDQKFCQNTAGACWCITTSTHEGPYPAIHRVSERLFLWILVNQRGYVFPNFDVTSTDRPRPSEQLFLALVTALSNIPKPLLRIIHEYVTDPFAFVHLRTGYWPSKSHDGFELVECMQTPSSMKMQTSSIFETDLLKDWVQNLLFCPPSHPMMVDSIQERIEPISKQWIAYWITFYINGCKNERHHKLMIQSNGENLMKTETRIFTSSDMQHKTSFIFWWKKVCYVVVDHCLHAFTPSSSLCSTMRQNLFLQQNINYGCHATSVVSTVMENGAEYPPLILDRDSIWNFDPTTREFRIDIVNHLYSNSLYGAPSACIWHGHVIVVGGHSEFSTDVDLISYSALANPGCQQKRQTLLPRDEDVPKLSKSIPRSQCVVWQNDLFVYSEMHPFIVNTIDRFSLQKTIKETSTNTEEAVNVMVRTTIEVSERQGDSFCNALLFYL